MWELDGIWEYTWISDFIKNKLKGLLIQQKNDLFYWIASTTSVKYESRYSRMDQVKFVEDSL